MTVTMKLEGWKELEEALDDLTKAAGKGALRRALKTAAEPLADKMRAGAPVLRGNLQRSITVSTRLSKRQDALHRRMFRDDKASVEIFVGPSYTLGAGGRHGHLVEFGTYKVDPQPFARPAWDADKLLLLDRLGKECWVEIKKSVARAERKAARLAAKG